MEFCGNGIVKKFIQKGYILIWVSFFIYLLCQHNMMWLHFDDYGYMTLNYAVSVGTTGQNYGFTDILQYLYLHYMEWGGRVLFYGVWIVIYHYLGLNGIRIAQAIIIWLIFYIIFRISRYYFKSTNVYVLSILACLTYGMFQANLTSESIYWFAASVGYVWPILALMLATYIFFVMSDREKFSIKMIFIDGILWFVSGFSQEQIAVASVMICLCCCIYSVFKNKNNMKYSVIFFGCVLIGLLILTLAPGNMIRLGESEGNSLLEQFKYNFPYMIIFLGLDDCKIFTVFFSLCFSIAALKVKTNIPNICLRFLILFYGLISGVVSSIALLSKEGIGELQLPYFVEIYAIYLSIGVVILVAFLKQSEMLLQLIFLIGALSCYGIMAFMPTIPYRILTPFIFLFIPVGIGVVSSILDRKSVFLLLPIWILLIGNITYTFYGYFLNEPYQEDNYQKLLSAKEDTKEGNIPVIKLKKMLNGKFAGPMSYDDGNEWSESLIKGYFELPLETIFIWEE